MGCRTYENLCSHRNALNPPLKQTFRHIHPTVGLVTCVGLWNGHANGHRGVNTQKTVRANDDLMERPLNPPLNRENAEVCAVRQMCLKAKTLKSARGSVSVCNCFLDDGCGADKVRMRVCICQQKRQCNKGDRCAFLHSQCNDPSPRCGRQPHTESGRATTSNQLFKENRRQKKVRTFQVSK